MSIICKKLKLLFASRRITAHRKSRRFLKDYEISITLNASFNQVEQLKAVSTYDGAEIFEGISEKGA